MFKLIFLTLLGLAAVFTIFGDGEGRRVEPPKPQISAPADIVPADIEPAVSAETVQQTPEKVEKFPGPPLRPSPEHAGETPAEDLAEAPTDTLYVTGNSVNFRAGPTTSDAVVGRLTRGERVTAIGLRNGDWVEIRDDSGRSGFMSAQFLSAERP
ncbi:SH3 domain-containing protein [Paracoccus aurantiacus]|nr:SH3 domain-containing protein [Paracoccus aurantiacus]